MNPQINEKRRELASLIESEATVLIENDVELIELSDKIREFGNDSYMAGTTRIFNECGDLVSQLHLNKNYFKDFEEDMQIELKAQLTKDSCVWLLEYGGDHVLETTLGDATTISFSDRRNCYAVHSNELGLKINYSDLVGEDDGEKEVHALYLIECAMRKAGVFGNIVTLDYNGNVVSEPSTELGNLSDDELEEYGKQFDESEE